MLLLSAAPLTGCRGALSSLDAAGPVAASIARLWWVMFAGATALFILVLGLLWWAYRKPGYAARTASRTWLLYAGVLMPVLLLAALAVYALLLGQQLVLQSQARVVQVEAVGTQWAWRFRYPQLDAQMQTPALHIPAGQPVEVRVISEDVIHSFWVPRLAGKIDAIPGHTTRVQLQADRPGEYEGVCAEFCGLGHAGMHFRVIAHAADQYRAALAEAAR